MYFVVVESKERVGAHKLGVDVDATICVCCPSPRSPMAQRVSELGRSVPLNTAVLCWGLAQGLPHTTFSGGARSWGRIVRRNGRITLGTELGGGSEFGPVAATSLPNDTAYQEASISIYTF